MRSSQTEINSLVSKPISQYWLLLEERLLGLVDRWSDAEWGCYWCWVFFDRTDFMQKCRCSPFRWGKLKVEEDAREVDIQITFSKPPGRSGFACVPTLIFSMWAILTAWYSWALWKNEIKSVQKAYAVKFLWHLLVIITCFRNIDRVV